MISDPKLPFESAPTGLETRVGSSTAAPTDDVALEVSDARPVGPNEQQPSSFHRPISTVQVWLRRLGVLLFVFICATIGVMLMIVPWRPEWSENPLLLSYPALHDLVASGFTRGLVTGLGLLNVWIGFWEALQYRED